MEDKKIYLQKLRHDASMLLEKHNNNDPKKLEKYNFYFADDKTIHAKRTNKALQQTKEKPLGKGAYGSVVKTFTVDVNGKIITKAKKKVRVNSQKDLVELRQEIGILKLLGEDVPVVSTGEAVNFCMDYRKGEALLEKNFGRELSLQDKLNLAKQATSAVDNIHSKGVWHRDIKGDNFVVDPDDSSVKLVDFGLSEYIGLDGSVRNKYALKLFLPAAEDQGAPVGTPGYTAPEVLDGYYKLKSNLQKDEYLSSDIYSLGKVFMYDMGIYNLGIVYKMVNPNYQNRPNLSEIHKYLDYYAENLKYIQEEEQLISKEINLSKKVQQIKDLFVKYDICSDSYYSVLKEVLQNGTIENLELMKHIPLFNNLFRRTILPSGIVLSKPLENRTKELLLLAAQNTTLATNMTITLIKHIIATEQKDILANIVADKELYIILQIIQNNMKFFNKEELLFLKQLNKGLSGQTYKEKLSKLSTDYKKLVSDIDCQSSVESKQSPTSNTTSSSSIDLDSSVGYISDNRHHESFPIHTTRNKKL